MDTGAVDDMMFNTYLGKCLSKLGQATYPILETLLYIDDFQDRLPDNFHAVREAWMCTETAAFPYRSANSFYSQAASATTIQIAPMIMNGVSCNNPECTTGCGECMPHVVQAVYKTNNELARTYVRQYLLKPGNISAKKQCDVDYMDNWQKYSTPYSSSYDSFDIRDNKFVTNFRRGVVNLVFYGTEYDSLENQKIPDNYRIREYIESFLKYKIFETLSNQINDETYNQLREKLIYYKQLSDEAFIMANTELMKQDIWTKQRRIKNSLNRHKMYELPNHTHIYSFHRNT
jgi:hypothetical protein